MGITIVRESMFFAIKRLRTVKVYVTVHIHRLRHLFEQLKIANALRMYALHVFVFTSRCTIISLSTARGDTRQIGIATHKNVLVDAIVTAVYAGITSDLSGVRQMIGRKPIERGTTLRRSTE